MSRRWLKVGVLGLAVLAAGVLLLARPVLGFIERPLSLKELIAKRSDYILLAKVEKVDASRPAMVLVTERDLKEKTPFRRMPVNLTGDKEKHTPQLLKRIAADLTVVVFLAEGDEKHEALAYTNGTWFQMLGHKDGDSVRWAFTHCEIYLRRTFKGTTQELIRVLEDALSGKKPPPDVDKKEPPGFGPELETKPPESKTGLAARRPLLGVIALPFLMPVAALLQLLFPGLLRDQWRQYKIAVYILLTQSTLLFAHMALVNWVVTERAWWLGEHVLWGALVLVALIGAVWALIKRRQSSSALPLPSSSTFGSETSHTASAALRPVRVEYAAFGLLAFAGLGWAAYLLLKGKAPIDQMGVVTLASLAAVLHLVYRRLRSSRWAARPRLSTEVVFLWTLAVGGAGIGLFLNAPTEANANALSVAAEWPAFRGNQERTGSIKADDPGIVRPGVHWMFDSRERRNRVRFDSSPTVLDGQLYIGALHEGLTLAQGYVYCVNADDGRFLAEKPMAGGQRIWRFSDGGSLKPVFSSPSVAKGRLYFGEGYHEDKSCRLFCLDAASGNQPLWVKRTASHVESGPRIVGNRVFFGAGDDGILCVDADDLTPADDGVPSPRTLWHLQRLHVDSSPLVVGNRLFAGTVVGDVYRELCLLAVDADSGRVVWKLPVEYPAAASPAHAKGRVFFALGTGKVSDDAEGSAGSVLCVDAHADVPKRLWHFTADAAVLATPALAFDSVFVCSRKGQCIALRQSDGEVQWRQQLDAGVVASPVVAGGKVYVLTTAGTLHCLDARTGDLLWRFDELKQHADNDVYSSPTLADGRLYVAVGGRLFCIGESRESNP